MRYAWSFSWPVFLVGMALAAILFVAILLPMLRKERRLPWAALLCLVGIVIVTALWLTSGPPFRKTIALSWYRDINGSSHENTLVLSSARGRLAVGTLRVTYPWPLSQPDTPLRLRIGPGHALIDNSLYSGTLESSPLETVHYDLRTGKRRHFLGAGLIWNEGGRARESHLFFPHWHAITLLAIVAAGCIVAYPATRRRSRRKQGLCVICAYNLTGTPPAADGSRRCSECGTLHQAPDVREKLDVAENRSPASA